MWLESQVKMNSRKAREGGTPLRDSLISRNEKSIGIGAVVQLIKQHQVISEPQRLGEEALDQASQAIHTLQLACKVCTGQELLAFLCWDLKEWKECSHSIGKLAPRRC